MDKIGLSILMIVKNEETHLPRCLDSLHGLADEIIVVDTGSTDQTVSIASKKGAGVFHEPWQDDFSKARNRSILEARGKWLLWMDADDLLPSGEHSKLRALIRQEKRSAYSFIVENEYEGRRGQAFRQIRLFPAGPGIQFQGRIHESLSGSLKQAGLPVEPADVRILHTGYGTAAEREKKLRRNHALLQEEYKSHPEDPAVLMELGNSFFQMKEYEKALEFYALIENLPGAGEKQRDIYQAAPVLMGTALFEQGLLEDAKYWFRKAITRFPEGLAAHYYLGQIAIRQNEPDTLLYMCEKVISLNPPVSTVAEDAVGMKANAYAFAGNLYFVRGDYPRAVELFQASEERGLPPAFQYETAAEAAQKAGSPALAERFARKASAPAAR
jgi:glycosyltransferase involved in cell wall biosynthesis